MSNDPKLEIREDDWYSAVSGLGDISRDKRLATTFVGVDISQELAEQVWRGCAMAAVLVEDPIDEMFREGWEFELSASSNGQEVKVDAFPVPGAPAIPPPPPKKPGPVARPDEESQAQHEALEAYLDDLGVDEALQTALKYMRAYGGGVVLLGINDGQADLSKPVDPEKIQSVDFVTALSCYECYAVEYYADPAAPKYGKPMIYQISAQAQPTNDPKMTAQAIKGTQRVARVHESRVVAFSGPVVSARHRQEKRGFGDSIFTRIYPVLRDYETVWLNTATLMTDFAQAVYTMAKLEASLATDKGRRFRERLQAMDYGRSTLRAIVVGEGDKFERQQTPLTGLPEILREFASRLAAVGGVPVTRLMGTSPGGLNATGESDIRFYYDRIAGLQHSDLEPGLEKIVRSVLLAKNGPTGGLEPDQWSIEFCPLWQESETQKIANYAAQATADKAYIDAGVVSPEEVAVSRFGNADSEIVLDFDARDQAGVEAEQAAADAEKAKAEALAAPPAPVPAMPAPMPTMPAKPPKA